LSIMEEKNTEKKMYTVQEAATYLGVSRIKISQLLRDKDLTAIPNKLDSREKLIAKDQLDELLRQYGKGVTESSPPKLDPQELEAVGV